MAAHYELDAERRVVHSRASGVVTDADLLWHVKEMQRLFAADVIDAAWAQIADFTAAEKLEVTPATVRRVAQENPWPKEAPRAVVVNNELGFGFSRMYETLISDKAENLMITRTFDEALQWLSRKRAADHRPCA